MESNDRLEQLLRQMYAEEEVIDEEWKKFEAKHFTAKRLRGWMQIAATIISVLVLSGIAYAAIWSLTPSPSPAGEGSSNAQQLPLQSERAGGEAAVVFDNVQLDSMLTIVAQHYQKQVVYRNDDVRTLHFHIEWNQAAPLSDFITLINNFEGISLREENDTIIAE